MKPTACLTSQGCASTATGYSAIDTFTAMHRLLWLRRSHRAFLPASMRWSCPRRRARSADEMHGVRSPLNNRPALPYFANLLTCARWRPNGVLPNGIPWGDAAGAAWSDRALMARRGGSKQISKTTPCTVGRALNSLRFLIHR